MLCVQGPTWYVSELFLETNKESTFILDEIQHLPGLFPLLRGSVDRHQTCFAQAIGREWAIDFDSKALA